MVVTTGFIAGNIFLPKKSYPIIILDDWIEEENNIFTNIHFNFNSRSDNLPTLYNNITYFDLINLDEIKDSSPYWLLYVQELTSRQYITSQIIKEGEEHENITSIGIMQTVNPESYLLSKNMSYIITDSFIQTIRPVITSGVKISNEEYRNYRVEYFENSEKDKNRFTADIRITDTNNTIVYITFYNTGIAVSVTTLEYLQDKDAEYIYPPRDVGPHFLDIENFEEIFETPFIQTWNTIFQSLTN